ncbi:hypothetical protein ST47_g6526 [Ascochyta rabiei]|uniref:Uncharacterized protein n=1 Tax=Didymella rabiei TaxID=5454 RepID=A0A163CAR1_DIDRA|nr:hypothetical protein ST47_g6526 [Ascochyta rabiei]
MYAAPALCTILDVPPSRIKRAGQLLQGCAGSDLVALSLSSSFMSTYERVSRLARAEATGSVRVIPMGGVEFVPFDKTPSVGTRDLAGCSVVIVASQYGAILAHIPPRPENALPSDTSAGDRNIALQEQKKIVEGNIQSMGLSPHNTILYVTPRDPTNPGQGTAFVDSKGRGDQKPRVWVEDRLVSNEQQSSHLPEQAAPQAESATQIQQGDTSWTWNSQYLRYYRYENGQVVWAPETS